MLTLDNGIDTDARANRNSDWQRDFPPTLFFTTTHHVQAHVGPFRGSPLVRLIQSCYRGIDN